MSIGIALWLAAAAAGPAPVAMPAAIGRKRHVVTISTFRAPVATLDLRRYSRDADPVLPVTLVPSTTDLSADVEPPRPEDFRVSSLVSRDSEAQYTGRRLRRSGMAAGLSLRMTNDDGVLASRFDMAGPVGRALSRVALAAVTPE